ncbi:MAG: periplasmic heavy metal sensor [Stagnimonas sp.]|nr:periplasmic heavy metal sensor [Stagnimonas sp.]
MTTPSTKRWLIVSLVLNVFLLGAIAGGLGPMGHRPPPGFKPGMGGPMEGLRGVEQALSPEGQLRVRQFFDRHAPEMRIHLEALRQQRSALDAAFAADPFDAHATEREFAILRAKATEAAQLVQQRLIELAQSLSQADRKVFAAGMSRLPMPAGGRMPPPPGHTSLPPPMPPAGE